MEEEVWKPVVGYEGLYEVSNLGRVKSLARKINGVCNNLPCVYTKKEKILKTDEPSGYHRVMLWYKDKKERKQVHRLVLESFIGPCPEGMECCHSDGDPSNNRLDNLRWDTHSNNQYDCIKHGRHVDNKGENNGMSKLKDGEVWLIKKLLLNGIKRDKITEMFKISPQNLVNIIKNRTWKHVVLDDGKLPILETMEF